MVYDDDARETADTSLEKLAAELAARGFQTRLTAPEGRLPSLAVTNREAAMLTETVWRTRPHSGGRGRTA